MAFEVQEQTFKATVIDRSFQVPVVVDFWAEWCNPCRVLGPVLEKLEKEYKGAFILAKVNTDLNQQLSMMFRISSIPDVRIIKEGKIVDQFMGAIPEKDIRKILAKHITLQKGENDIETLAEENPMEFLRVLKELKEVPENRDALIWLSTVSHIKHGGKVEEIKILLESIEEENASFANQRRILLGCLETEAYILEDLKNLFNPSKKLEILDKYLSKVENANFANRKNIKDELLACFYVLPVEDEDVPSYRRKLSSLLF